MGHIDFEATTDRDLLVQVVTGVNGICERLDKINGTIERHEKRITTLEALPHCEKPKLDWQMIGVVSALLGGGIYAVCHFLGV